MLRQRWPHPTSWRFADAVTRVCGGEVEAALHATSHRLRTLDALAKRPIVAVAGMLNAGKTSVVARFLSDDGRARAPRGLRAADGTQRFVLWLPDAWQQDAEIWDAVQDHVREVFGAPGELLDPDPDRAHAQYSGAGAVVDHFGVPLLATDPALDDVGFAFLDCPDVQRRHGDTEAAAVRGARLSVLGRAAQLCSAFFVVSTLDGVQDRTLHAILEEIAGRAPGVRRYLLLNKLRPDIPPHEAHAELEEVGKEHDISGVFGAWDFAIDGHEEWSPAAALVDGSPTFYALAADPHDNPPHSPVEGRQLQDLASLLPVGELHAEKVRSLRTTLERQTRRAIEQIVSAATESQQRITDAQEGVLTACTRTLLDPDGHLRVPIDQAFLDAFLASLERTAPLYVRVFMMLNRPLRALSRAAREGIETMTKAMRPVQDMRDRFVQEKRGVRLDAERLANALKGEDVDHLVSREANVPAAARRAVERFVAEHHSRPDPAELDEAARDLWAAMPLWQKATAAVTTMTSLAVGLAAMALLPFDGGSFGVIFLSAKEIVAATLMGGALGMAAEVPLRRALERHAGWPAFSDLRALLCDTLGLPRERVDGSPWLIVTAGQSVPIPSPQVSASPPADHALALLETDPGWTHRLAEAP